MRLDVLEQIRSVYDLGPGPGGRRIISVLGRDWLLGSGGASGYRYRLQDSDLGLILFIGSRYAKDSMLGHHLKLEVSPHYIDARKSDVIQRHMDRYASQILVDPQPSGCAVHLCVDIQGWQPPKDIGDLLITRSRRRVDHRGISNVEFDLSEIASTYGAAQSFLFGSASGACIPVVISVRAAFVAALCAEEHLH